MAIIDEKPGTVVKAGGSFRRRNRKRRNAWEARQTLNHLPKRERSTEVPERRKIGVAEARTCSLSSMACGGGPRPTAQAWRAECISRERSRSVALLGETSWSPFSRLHGIRSVLTPLSNIRRAPSYGVV